MEMEIDFVFNSGNVETFEVVDPDYEYFLSSTGYSGEDEVVVPAASSVVEGLVEVEIGKENSNGYRCVVCTEEFEEGEKVKALPCGHYYHGDCIIPWLRITNTCPICRYELPTDDEDYERRRRSQGGSVTAAGGSG